MLLFLFVMVLIIQRVSLEIFGKDPPEETVRRYFNLGWVGFVLVILFNFGYFALWFVDIYNSCKYTARESIASNKKHFAFTKVG